MQLSAAAPAPDATNFTSASLRPEIFNQLTTAAATIIAVPCWSS